MTEWTPEQARAAYNIPNWSGGYVDVDHCGHLMMRPRRGGAAVDLYALSEAVRAAGLALPVLARFPDILADRVDTLCGAFEAAIAAQRYGGRYTAVYPIKVNQQRAVVEAIVRHGGERTGLEAGSKPELMVVLGSLPDNGRVIVCNGYKDAEYIRLALHARRLGHRIYIVVEKRSELDIVLREAAALGIRPLLGVRARLASIGAGKWQNTGGEKSKFGLTSAQLLETVDTLRGAGLLDGLQLLHFHLGSQISNIRDLQNGLAEAARVYAALRQAGAPVEVLDVGGGLGVDYEGTRSRSFCSMNYSVEEYATNIVRGLAEFCRAEALPPPHLFTEAGRAMTAHHAVLLTHLIDHESLLDQPPLAPPPVDDPPPVRELWHSLEAAAAQPPEEAWHDAVLWMGEAQELFRAGRASLSQRARAERYYAAACLALRARLSPANRAQREILDELDEKLADKYFLNLSVFQSLPDVWAIDQIFPIVPLHRLNEPPARRGVLKDLTCDSDGRVDHYVTGEGVSDTLPLHAPRRGEDYRLGIFLVGAYQEILGDMHNLFGDVHAVNVRAGPDGAPLLEAPARGDTVDGLLRSINHRPEDLLAVYRAKVAAAGLPPAQAAAALGALQAGLSGYTYLEIDR
jgi:arginine decarboxylase